MPYALTFRKPFKITNSEQYINECCIGGDLVLDQLLPALKESYDDIEANQEDWGWFAWFESSGVKLAVDIFADDPAAGEFQIHLTARRPRFLLSAKVEDTSELEELLRTVMQSLEAWSVEELKVERVNEKYMPIPNGN